MNTHARMAIPALSVGALLVLFLAFQWPLSLPALMGALGVAAILIVAWNAALLERFILKPLKTLRGQELPQTLLAAEVRDAAGKLSELQAELERTRGALQAETLARERAQRDARDTREFERLNAGWEWNASGDAMRFSEGWKAMLGFADDQFSDTHAAWKNRIHPADLDAVVHAFQDCVSGVRDSFESEHRLLHRDMTARWIQSRARAVRDASGRASHLIGIDVDVTAFKRMQDVLRQVVEATAGVTGDAFFRELVRRLALTLNVPKVLLTCCVDAPATRVRTLACWVNGEFQDTQEYDLAGTPCAQVVQQGVHRFHARALRTSFPFYSKLTEESYFGLPVKDAGGTVLGHLAMLSDRPMDADIQSAGVMNIFAARAAAEMIRVRLDRAVAKLVVDLEYLPHEERLRQIARCFAELIGVREAIVTRCVAEPHAKLRVLAWWRDGRFEPDTEYNLVGTTCEETITQGRICIYPQGVGVRFPPARPFGRESYVGVPCFDAHNTVIGHLAGFHNKALPADLPEPDTLRLFARRAAMELHQIETLH